MTNQQMLISILDTCNVQHRTNETEEPNVVFYVDGTDTEIMLKFDEKHNTLTITEL